MNKPKLRRNLVVLAVVVMVNAMVATGAYAHYVKAGVTIWESGSGFCGQAIAEVSHGNNGQGFFWSNTHGKKPQDFGGYRWNCHLDWARSANNYAVKQHVHKWDGSDWNNICFTNGWGYSRDNWVGVEYKATFNSVPCGSGWYRTATGSYVKDFGGTFRGSWIDSRGGSTDCGCHQLPT